MSFITATNSEGYEAPIGIAVDPVLITVIERESYVLMVEDKNGQNVLPGAFIPAGKSAEETVAIKLEEKTGIKRVYMEQLHTFTAPDRDNRGWVPSVAFLALVSDELLPAGQFDAEWRRTESLENVGYDHEEIIALGMDRLRTTLWKSTIVKGLLPESFTLNSARDVYETLTGKTYKQSNFGRDLMRANLIIPTGEKISNGRGRPSDLYTFTD